MTEPQYHHPHTPTSTTTTTTTSLMSLTAAQIPCCICGTMIYPNAANQCTTCLSQDFNLQDYIQRPPSSATGNVNNTNDESHKIVIHQCRNCRRFQRTEKCWEFAEHESSQLMSICLKHIPALQHHTTTSTSSMMTSSSSSSAIGPIRLMDAQWIWTEPHCMRYKIRCTIQTEIHQVRVQQRVVVLLHCVFKMCPDCTREFNHRTWQSVVQLRQKVSAEQQLSSSTSTSTTTSTTASSSLSSKNGLMILEQTLAKNKEIRKHVLKIDQVPHNGGFDFYFISIPHAHTFVSFLQRIIPMRVRTSKKLVSTDAHSKNMANMKHTMVCDMVPFNVHDLIVIHKSTSKCKFAGHLVLVTKLASVIHLINAAPQPQLLLQSNNTNSSNKKNVNTTSTNNSMMDDCIMELSAETYYKQEKQYRVLQASHRLVRFVVLDVELLEENPYDTSNNTNSLRMEQKQSQPFAMAEVLVARESDMGRNDRTYNAVTHLGRDIEAGDIVLGYDLTSSSVYLDEDDMKDTFYHNFSMPDIVLVKKAPPTTVAGDTKLSVTSKSSKKSLRNNKEKKQQRRCQNDGKRARELEIRAKRMGFVEGEVDEVELDDDDDDTTQPHRQNSIKNDDTDSLIYDTDILNEVLALEREFETLDMQTLEHPADDDDNVEVDEPGDVDDDDDDDYENADYE